MTFNIQQLDNLDYDEAESLLEDYIIGVLEEYINSPEGEAYFQERQEGCGWIATFIELGYLYQSYTLSTMTKADVQILMEKILPRKITIIDPSETTEAIPELISFWQFLGREYKLTQAKAIIKYLEQLGDRFSQLMNNPNSGGFMKSLLMQAHQEGFDISSQEGLSAFQEKHNAEQRAKQTAAATPKKSPQAAPKSENVPKAMQAKYQEIIDITDRFAAQYLNEEYAQLIRQLTATLARKRPSPLDKGKANSWAAGITHAIGMVNFLFDPSQNPHISAAELYKAFGVAQSTGQGKSKQVRDLLDMSRLDPQWVLPSNLENHPSAIVRQLINTMLGNN
jgi:hypothetical protein